MKKAIFSLGLIVLSFMSMAQKEWVLQSEHLAQPDTIWAFIPEDVPEGKKLSAVILLHGYGGNYKQWNRILDLQQLADRYQMIFVCPDGLSDSWYFNSPRKQGSNYESFFFETFVASIFRELPINPNELFIDGLSMGGHGAVRLFLRKPELFKAVASSSGVLDLKCSGLRNTSLKKHLGAYSEKAWLDYTAIGSLLKTRERRKPILITCGRKDHLLRCNREFVDTAVKLGYNITYIEQRGKHNSAYWQSSFYMHIAFFLEQLH